MKTATIVGSAFLIFVATATACGGETVTFPEGSGGSGTGSGTATGTGTGTGVGGDGGGPGICDCDAPYFPVCGDDGTTYDAACGEQCVPVPIACEGECPCDPCAALEAQYAEALAEAKICDPAIDVEQCTERIGNELSCPCPTSVSPANAAAFNELKSLTTEWQMLACSQDVLCPAVECAEIKGAFCGPSTNGPTAGSCQEQLGDG